jgi:hypothetical protein
MGLLSRADATKLECRKADKSSFIRHVNDVIAWFM